jgi:hypothetical protein
MVVTQLWLCRNQARLRKPKNQPSPIEELDMPSLGAIRPSLADNYFQARLLAADGKNNREKSQQLLKGACLRLRNPYN